MISVGAPVISYKVMESMLVHATIQRYLGMTIHVPWQDTFLDRIPIWLALTDYPAVEGICRGEVSAPWTEWWLGERADPVPFPWGTAPGVFVGV